MQREKTKTIFLLVSTFLAYISPAFAADTVFELSKIDENGSSSCRRSHNAGLHVDGRTFICWAGPKMAPCVKTYDHKTGTWSLTRIIHPYSNKDYHDYPTMILGKDKHLHVFWTRHNREIHYCRSPKPLDITGKWTHQVIKHAGATYPCPMLGPKGELYLFFRGRGNPTRSHGDYLKSIDNGKSWQLFKDAISTEYNGKTNGFYLQNITAEPARDGKPLSYQLSWSLRFGPRSPLVNVYFARFYPGEDVFKSIDGTDLGKSISQEEAMKYCLIKKANNIGWRLLSHSFKNNQVIVFYSYWKKEGQVAARWTDEKWIETDLPFDIKEVEYLSSSNTMRVYGPHENGMAWWESSDSTNKWKQSGTLALPGKSLTHCVLIDNYNPDIQLYIRPDPEWPQMNYNGTQSIFVLGQKKLNKNKEK